jgi:hypothetical protein
MKRFLLALLFVAAAAAAEPKVTVTHYTGQLQQYLPVPWVENVMIMIEDDSTDIDAYKIVTTWKDGDGHAQANVQVVPFGSNGASRGYTFAWLWPKKATELTVTVSSLRAVSVTEVRQ